MSGRTHSKEFKAKVALAVIKGEKTLNELASMYELHPSVMREWKNILLSGASNLFEGAQKDQEKKEQEALLSRLYQEIGQLKVALDWLKKSLTCSSKQRQQWIEALHPQLSISEQCRLLGIARSRFYRPGQEREENLKLMRRIDAQ